MEWRTKIYKILGRYINLNNDLTLYFFSCCIKEEKIEETTYQDHNSKVAEPEFKSRPIWIQSPCSSLSSHISSYLLTALHEMGHPRSDA